MNQLIFKIVADAFKFISKITGFTYNEINVISYYFLMPFSWLVLLDFILEFHYFKFAFVIFTVGFYVGCRNFRTYSDWLFHRSVVFLNYFNKIGSSYIISSVWICVAFPIAVYIVLFYLWLK